MKRNALFVTKLCRESVCFQCIRIKQFSFYFTLKTRDNTVTISTTPTRKNKTVFRTILSAFTAKRKLVKIAFNGTLGDKMW